MSSLWFELVTRCCQKGREIDTKAPPLVENLPPSSFLFCFWSLPYFCLINFLFARTSSSAAGLTFSSVFCPFKGEVCIWQREAASCFCYCVCVFPVRGRRFLTHCQDVSLINMCVYVHTRATEVDSFLRCSLGKQASQCSRVAQRPLLETTLLPVAVACCPVHTFVLSTSSVK